MIWLIGFFILITSVLFFIALFQLLFNRKSSLQKRMEHYLSYSEDDKSYNEKKLSPFVQLQLTKQQVRRKFLTKEKNTKLEVILRRAGVPLKPEEYVLFQWISVGLVGGVFYLLSTNLLLSLLLAGVGYFIPGWYISKKQKQRLARFNEGLPDMLSTIIGSLRAGFSFLQALKTVSEEADTPIKDEMEFVIKEMQYGKGIEDALNSLKERMPSEDLDLMIQAILIQRQVGGNLATILEKIVETIRDRTKIQRQIQTLTAQGRLSGIVIGLLPLILGLLIYLIEPDYIGSLFTHPIGIIMISAGCISGVIGFIFIRKLTTIEV